MEHVMNHPNFFIIGAPKCGTSALAYYLSEHPQVYFSYPKEPYYWADDFPGLQRQFGVSSLEQYRKLFDHAPKSAVAIGEGSTVYLASSQAVQRIIEFQPSAKFIVMLRNPVDLVVSSHMQELSHLNEDVECFETAWKLQEKRRLGQMIPKHNYEPAMLQYRQVASLGEQVQRLVKTVPGERVQIIFFDDFQVSTQTTYEQTLQFLGLDYDNRTEFPRINEGKLPGIKWLSLALQGKTGTNISRFLNRTLKGPIRTFANRTKKLLTTRKHVREPLTPDLRRQLIETFAADVQMLSDCTGRDLSSWCR